MADTPKDDLDSIYEATIDKITSAALRGDINTVNRYADEGKAALLAREERIKLEVLGNLGFDKRLDNPILYCKGDEAIPIDEYIAALRHPKPEQEEAE